MAAKKYLGTVLHRRHLHANSSMRWKLHLSPYMPAACSCCGPDCAPDGRFVVSQVNRSTGIFQHLFDVVNDDGSLHPLDRRVIDAINLRDGKWGAQEKAIKDVEEAPERAATLARAELEEATGDLFERIHYDVSKHATGGACITPDPAEDELVIENV